MELGPGFKAPDPHKHDFQVGFAYRYHEDVGGDKMLTDIELLKRHLIENALPLPSRSTYLRDIMSIHRVL